MRAIEVTPPSPSIAAGTTQVMQGMGIFDDGSKQDLTPILAWSSSDQVVASMAGSTARGLLPGTTTVSATHPGSGIEGSTIVTITPALLTSIALTPALPQIALGTDVQLTASGTFSDDTVQDLTALVTWSSTGPSTATVSNAEGTKGLASGVSIGSSTIVATDPATGIQGSVALTVTAAVLSSIEVTPFAPSIALGTTLQLAATGLFSDSTAQDLTTAVSWSSSSSAVATVDSVGFASSLSVGATAVTATEPGSAIAGSTALTINPAVLVTIDVTPPASAIALGTEQALVATGTFSDSTTQDLTAAVTWSSSSTAVATVSNAPGSEGLASSASIGLTTVTATDPGTAIAGATTLTVTPAVLTSIGVTPAGSSIALGTTQSFTATGVYSDGSTQDLTAAVTWSSSAPAIAILSNAAGSKGLATSIAAGLTTITATDPGTASAGATTLTVTPAVLVSIGLTPESPSIALGTTQSFTATGVYSDGSTQDLTASVTWSSSAPAIAILSNAAGSKGLATSIAAGLTTVTAADPGTAISDATSLAVTPAALVTLTVTPPDPTIALGTARQFAATGTYTDGSTQDLTTSVTWSSSVPAVATVGNATGIEGLATSAAVGQTTITATDPVTTISGSSALAVTPAVLSSITVVPAGTSVAVGAAVQFTATGSYSDASTQDVTDSVTWSSSTPAVASVSNAAGSEGLATTASAGSTNLTATDGSTGVVGSAALTAVTDITFRGASSAAAPTGPTLDLATPAGTQSGDLLIAAIAVRPSSAVLTPPAGWTLVHRIDNPAGNSNSLAVYHRTATPGEPGTQTWASSASTGLAGGISGFYGIAAAAPIEVEAGQSTPSSLTHSTPSVTTASAGAMVITAHALASSAAWTPPAGMSEALEVSSLSVPNGGGISLEVNYGLQVGAGPTGTRSAVASGDADTGNAHILSLKPGP